MKSLLAIPALVLAASFMTACGPTIRPDFDSPEPAARDAAIVRAAARHDATAVPSIVRLLGSDDPGTRLLAINALERLTGRTHGYVASDPESARAEAIARWQEDEAARPARVPASTDRPHP